MIPKRLFYAWFGKGEMNETYKRCFETWKQFTEGWEVVRIDESTFDVTTNEFAIEAYENKAWTFVADVARMAFLKEHGGLYLDLDTRIVHPLDPFIENRAVVGMISHGFYGCGVLGCEPDYFPEIFEVAAGAIEKKKALHVELNRAIYERYNLKGEEYIQKDGIGFYGNSYVGNKVSKVTDRTIIVHEEENIWVDGWTGGFEVKADLVPLEIYVAGRRRADLISKWYGSRKPIGRLDADRESDVDIYLIDKANYFFNKRVKRVYGDGFRMERYGPRGTEKVSLYDGTILEYTKC